MQGIIFDIKEFGVHDGSGLVTTVFFKGCPLRCAWCHNPEGHSFEPELMVREKTCTHCGLCEVKCNHEECRPFKRCIHICPDNLVSIAGERLQARQLADRILKNKNIIDAVTFSGGEPLSQPEFLLETISYLDGLKVNIETSGFCDNETFKKVIYKVDFVYLDIKIADDELHKKYTGQSNKLILENLKYIIATKKPCVIRTPLIKDISDTKDNIQAIKELIGDLPHELLPYNEMAPIKYKMLHKQYPIEIK